MSIPELKNFSLVGGTALALRFGHRKSIDLDLFAASEFNTDTVVTALEKNFPSAYKHISTNSVGIFGYIEDVRIDLIKYHFYPLIVSAVEEEGIRFFGNEDLMAMKVNAILKRAVKKDFWDIAELLDYYTVEEMIDSYTKKFSNQMLLISIPRALTYFEDAENSAEPMSLKGQNWMGIKTRIRDKIDEFLQ
jgi:predicted nucleotidyltransferase component of viral defense system